MGGAAAELRDIGRSVVGGLIVGLPLLYTMETWWLAWRLPSAHRAHLDGAAVRRVP